jgi:hypothetical protein
MLRPSRKFLFWMMFVVALLLVLTVPVLAAAVGEDPAPPPNIQVPEVVMLLISGGAGWLAIKIINAAKTALGWTKPTDKRKNIWLTFGVSIVLSVLLLLITNSFVPLSGPQTVITWLGVIFMTATMIYKSSQSPAPEDPAGP